MQLKPEILSELAPERRAEILKRSQADVSNVYKDVRPILENIRENGDQANLNQHGVELQDLKPSDLIVRRQEIDQAYEKVPVDLVQHLQKAAANIRKFHAAQMERPMWQMEVSPGIIVGRKHTPLDSVGCYVPGMRASYPSTVLMTLLPAKVAEVDRLVVCTPPGPKMEVNPFTLVACDIVGVHEIYKLGGPWAVGSMAYGTPTVKSVRKIVGPGNKYVTAAKMLVYGQVDIDSPAGPSEALLLADESANPGFLALDFLSQVEHDPDAAAVLVTDSRNLAESFCSELARHLPGIPRKEIITEALRYSAVLVADSMDEAIAFSNLYAPEHLEIVTKEPFLTLRHIRNAGSIFMGPWAPVPVGDYASGTNHVLPTGGAAASFSGLSVDDFIKKPTFQYLTEDGLKSIASTVSTLAESEGLPVHAMTVKARLNK